MWTDRGWRGRPWEESKRESDRRAALGAVETRRIREHSDRAPARGRVEDHFYARSQRFSRLDDINDFAHELEDRFGVRPPEVAMLLDLALFGIKAAALGVNQVNAGPRAIALTPADTETAKRLSKATKRLEQVGDRLIYKLGEGEQVLAELAALLDDMAA